ISTGPKCPNTTSGWKKGCLRDRAKSYFWKSTQTPERPETGALLFWLVAPLGPGQGGQMQAGASCGCACRAPLSGASRQLSRRESHVCVRGHGKTWWYDGVFTALPYHELCRD